MNSQANQIEVLIAQIVEALESAKVELIAPEYVAKKVIEKLDPTKTAPDLVLYLAMMQARQSTRQYLRRKHDPVEKEKNKNLQTGIDLFAGELQPFYPVKRSGIESYCRPEKMTKAELLHIGEKMIQAGESLTNHGRAVLEYAETREQASGAYNNAS